MKIIKLLLTLLIFEYNQAMQLQFNHSLYQHKQQATKCLKNITRTLFKERTTIAFTDYTTLDTPGLEIKSNFIKAINLELNWNVIIAKENISADYYIIFINDTKILQNQLNDLKKNPKYKFRTRILIYFYKFVANGLEIVEMILKMLYDYKHYKTSVLIPNRLNELHLYAYDLYSKAAEYCATTPNVILLNSCVNGRFQLGKYVPHRYMNNLNCKIPVVALQIPPFVINETHGLEISILNEISHTLDVHFEITLIEGVQYWGNKTENGSWSGPLSIIYENQFIIGMGCISSVQENRLYDFEFTDDYFIERLVWVLPAAQLIDQWYYIFIVFNLNMWLLLILIVLLFGVFYIYIKRSFVGIFMSLQVIIGMSVWNQSKSHIFRVLFILEVYLALIMIALYQGKLFNVMSTPKYEHQIASDVEIFESNLQIGGVYAYKDIFEHIVENKREIFANYMIFDNFSLNAWIARVGERRSEVTVAGELYMKYLFALHDQLVLAEDGENKIYFGSNYILREPIRLIFPRGFPLKYEFDFIIAALSYSGLINKWANEYVHVGFNSRRLINQYNGVGLYEMFGAFLLLLIGCVLSALCLLIEIVLKKLAL